MKEETPINCSSKVLPAPTKEVLEAYKKKKQYEKEMEEKLDRLISKHKLVGRIWWWHDKEFNEYNIDIFQEFDENEDDPKKVSIQLTVEEFENDEVLEQRMKKAVETGTWYSDLYTCARIISK